MGRHALEPFLLMAKGGRSFMPRTVLTCPVCRKTRETQYHSMENKWLA